MSEGVATVRGMPRTPHVAVATCAAFPDLDEDADVLLAALGDAGLLATVHVWDDPAVDWTAPDVVLVRSVWDYPLRRDAFVAWVQRCPRTVNPAPVLAWNTDKRYLLDLAASGVPTVPTVFVPPGATLSPPADDYVLKPAVSGSAADTGRFGAASRAEADELVALLHGQGRTVMAQPYLTGIDDLGETSLVFLGAQYSHAVRRLPLLTGNGVRRKVVVADVLPTVRTVDPTPEQLAVAEAALDAVPGGRAQVAYARVDLVPGDDGPTLLELEVTDCFLFLGRAAPDAVARLAAATRAAATGA